MNEHIQTPEFQGQNPGQELVSSMSDTVRATLDAQKVVPGISEDGISTRTLVIDNGLYKLTEETVPDGTTNYRVRSLFKQSHDQGVLEMSWVAGGESLKSKSDLEIAGLKEDEIFDVKKIGYKKSDLEYIIGRIPTPERKSRMSRFLGRRALSR